MASLRQGRNWEAIPGTRPAKHRPPPRGKKRAQVPARFGSRKPFCFWDCDTSTKRGFIVNIIGWLMPKSDTQKRLSDAWRFQTEMVVWTWPGYSPCEIKMPRGCVGQMTFGATFFAALLQRCCRCCLYWNLFLTLACTNRPRSWYQPCSKRSSWKRLSRSRRSGRDGRKAVLRLWLLLRGEPDRNGGNRLPRLDLVRPVLSGSFFDLGPLIGLCCCLSPPKTLRCRGPPECGRTTATRAPARPRRWGRLVEVWLGREPQDQPLQDSGAGSRG